MRVCANLEQHGRVPLQTYLHSPGCPGRQMLLWLLSTQHKQHCSGLTSYNRQVGCARGIKGMKLQLAWLRHARGLWEIQRTDSRHWVGNATLTSSCSCVHKPRPRETNGKSIQTCPVPTMCTRSRACQAHLPVVPCPVNPVGPCRPVLPATPHISYKEGTLWPAKPTYRPHSR